jgi:hypothetical protein
MNIYISNFCKNGNEIYIFIIAECNFKKLSVFKSVIAQKPVAFYLRRAFGAAEAILPLVSEQLCKSQ